jgi:2-polyprenyl-3-methyl-5-hydroxy-6-metoxy-1,4-benzoquinol methylase
MTDPADLDRIADTHRQSDGFTPRLIRARDNTIRYNAMPGDVLDLGSADGILTRLLAAWNHHVVGVDASAVRVLRARAQTQDCRNVRIEQLTFEEFTTTTEDTFDTVVLSCVLEHVRDPSALLESTRSLLRRDGRLVAIVPNALSLHRRAGALMGIIPSPLDCSDLDVSLQHERHFTHESLVDLISGAGLQVAASGGHMLKPVPNQAMSAFPEVLIDAYEELGRRYVDLSAEVFAVGEWPY